MKLTVLGNNGPCPSPGGACSGYLLQGGGAAALIDLGSGSLANLMTAVDGDVEAVDAIILTHLHSDHCSDIHVLRYALDLFRPRHAASRAIAPRRLPLLCPSQPERENATLRSYEQFDVAALDEGVELAVGDLKFSFAAMTHPIPSFAVAAKDPSGRRFVYTGDTSWNLDIVQFAENADLLLADACLLSRDKTPGRQIFHMTADECGIVAAEAGAKRLLLTHFAPGSDLKRHVAEAEAGVQKVTGSKDRVAVGAAIPLETYVI